MSGGTDLGTDEGLRQALEEIACTGSWEVPAGLRLLDEVRHRAVRNASHVAAATGVRCDRALVDDVVTAAWTVLDHTTDQVLSAERPWAYVMSAAQQEVMAEALADRAVTSRRTTRGRNRQLAWTAVVHRVGAAAGHLAAAVGHGLVDEASRDQLGTRALRARRRGGEPVLVERHPQPPRPLAERAEWYGAFVGLLVEHGADESVTVAAVDHLADVFSVTPSKHWEVTTRQDPVLARIGLSPDQCSALVALMAGSRREREAGRVGGLLGEVRAGQARGVPVELSAVEQKRVRTYVDGTHQERQSPNGEQRLPVAGETVRAEMARSGITQEMIAARLGIRRQNVSTRLSGVVAWTLDDLVTVADLLAVPVTQLLNGRLTQSRDSVQERRDAARARPHSGQHVSQHAIV